MVLVQFYLTVYSNKIGSMLNMKLLFVIFLIVPFSSFGQTPQMITSDGLTGRLERFENFQSAMVDPRNVDVWLPADYTPKKKYAVIYMHDGQNLFIPELSYTKIDWGVDEWMTTLMVNGLIRPAIVVGIWNTPKRVAEYMPQKAVTYASREILEKTPKEMRESLSSDKYLKFIVTELKPFIDKKYSTRKERRHTFIMGSSMGGLISCYAISEYSQIFGGAGCISTHFPAGEGIVIDYLQDNLPKPKNHKIYFDYGTETLDATYEPFQKRMDRVMLKKGYRKGKNWMTLKFFGADHSERAWRERLDIPLIFLLGN